MDDFRMSIVDHLEELRRRLIISILVILVITAVAFFFADTILNLLLLPSGGLQLKAFGIMDGFLIKWRIALITGIVFAFPVWFYHLFRFVRPGLYDNEARAIFPGLIGSMVLFSLGALFGYYLLWGMIRVLIEFFPKEVEFLPAADDYISFVLFFMVSTGIAFQLPILLLILVQLRILNAEMMRKQRRIAYFALFVFAEIITPVSDPIIAPLTVMLPLVILYEISVWLAQRIEARRDKPSEEPSPS
jgi:sec-independent protein translocase protein TatC